jgi:hypothetical protein
MCGKRDGDGDGDVEGIDALRESFHSTYFSVQMTLKTNGKEALRQMLYLRTRHTTNAPAKPTILPRC